MAIDKKKLEAKLKADREQEAQKTETQKATAAAKQKKTADTTSPIIPEKKPNKRITSKVFSFWASRESIAEWQAYQKASNDLPTVEALGTAAITEYIRNHPLTAEGKAAYEALLVLEQQKAAAERAEAEKKYSK